MLALAESKLIEINDAPDCEAHSTLMWPYHPDLLATPVPRYTSYPTAADFGDIPSSTYRAALEEAHGDISLYVHIPFCEKICFYCGCNTAKSNRRKRLASYIVALQREIQLVGSLLPKDARVTRVSFGGGSPNAIRPSDMLLLIDSLSESFNLTDPVLSTELDPRTMTDAWAKMIARIGFERASLGVQTFAAHCQKAIGREQSDAQIARVVDWLREAGVTSLNFDLMYGLPQQSLDDLTDSLARTCELGADRIALFGYAHVPHMIPRQRVIDASRLPDQIERFVMAAHGFGYLRRRGYAPVGFDHFAKAESDPVGQAAVSGKLGRNFQGFTDDQAPITIGLGASAISCFPDLIAQNEKNSGRYRMVSSQDRLATVSGISRSPEDQRNGAVIEQLLCQGEATVSNSMIASLKGRLCPFIVRGLAALDGNRLSIMPQGLPYARVIAALFDPHREKSARQFSSAV